MNQPAHQEIVQRHPGGLRGLLGAIMDAESIDGPLPRPEGPMSFTKEMKKGHHW